MEQLPGILHEQWSEIHLQASMHKVLVQNQAAGEVRCMNA